MRSVIYALVLLTGMVRPSGAWSSLGHKAVAELAWREMSAAERREVAGLLKHHPHYNLLLAVDLPRGVDPDEWAFLNAATWPDLIRPAKKGEPVRPASITNYNIYPHAILLPVVRAGDVKDVSLAEFQVEAPNAETGLSNSLAVLGNKNASAQDRAVALTWVLHLCGDIHQPLHASTLVTKQRPQGNGAGGGFVVIDPKGNQVGLHTFWDAVLGMDHSYGCVSALADDLGAAPELRPAVLDEYRANKTVVSWGREGQQLAADFAYSEKHIDFVLSSDVQSAKVAQSDIPRMSREYASEAERIARRRLALAAWRLTDLLKAAF